MDQIATVRWFPKTGKTGLSAEFSKSEISSGELDQKIDELLFEQLAFSVTFGPDKVKPQKELQLA